MFETPPQSEARQQEKPFDLEQWLSSEFKSQYENKSKILNKLGLLDILPESQEIGIVGIDGKEYPFPERDAIEQAIREKEGFFETKIAQGFTELEIIPFDLPLDTLITTLTQQLIKHHQEGKLFHTRKNQDDDSEELQPFDLNEDDPLYIWEGYEQADEQGTLVYDVKEFSSNHQGKTKQELIDSQEVCKGYLVILREKNVNIPREGKGETIHDRKQFETDQTPKDYLYMLQTQKQYQGESGYTPEEWLVQFLVHLHKTNEVMDDHQRNGSAAFLIGAYFPASDVVPNGGCSRGGRRAGLSGYDPGGRNAYGGVRSAVRIGV